MQHTINILTVVSICRAKYRACREFSEPTKQHKIMKLTALNVQQIVQDCLFKEGEDTSEPVMAAGVLTTFGFHSERLKSHAHEVLELLHQLPDPFREDAGGGWSFLQACMTKDGEQWGEHRNIEQLLCLGIATKQAKILMPREMWSMFPGGMPYFSVAANLESSNHQQLQPE